MAYYLFNFVNGDATKASAAAEAAELMRLGIWGIEPDERHHDALAPGDLVLIYLGAPDSEFIGRAELASAAHRWAPSEAASYPGRSASGVLMTRVEEWDPPVPMSDVLAQMDLSRNAKAEFEAGVVRITAGEYETAVAVAAERASSTD